MDVIHPGYGFLSENADLRAPARRRASPSSGRARSCSSCWATRLRRARWRRKSASRRCPAPRSRRRARRSARRSREQIGFPLIIKAAFGGGGRGMRVVTRPADLADLLDEAQARSGARLRQSARCFSRNTSRAPSTSRCRSSATSTATSCISTSATARCSAGTRRSSRSRRRSASTAAMRARARAMPRSRIAQRDRLRQRRHGRVPGRSRHATSGSSSR